MTSDELDFGVCGSQRDKPAIRERFCYALREHVVEHTPVNVG